MSKSLSFTPYAWAKLSYFLNAGPTEISGFGISHEKDPMLVEDVLLIPQRATPSYVELIDTAVADYFDACTDAGLPACRFARIGIHTHPGRSAVPSVTDEATFDAVFGACDWAVQFILARGGQTFCTLRAKLGYGPHLLTTIPSSVVYQHDFPGSDRAAWALEYSGSVTCVTQKGTPVLADREFKGLCCYDPDDPGFWGQEDTYQGVSDVKQSKPDSRCGPPTRVSKLAGPDPSRAVTVGEPPR